MKEQAITNLLNNFANHFGITVRIENLQERDKIFQPLKEKDQSVFDTLHKFVMLFESLSFVKTDKMLMLKARDLWKMETDRMTVDLYDAVKGIEKIGIKLGIDMGDFIKNFE